MNKEIFILGGEKMARSKNNKSNNNIDNEKIILEIKRARQDVLTAEAYFQYVNEPELVDMAIYDLEAKKSKYSYLIRMAKERGVKKTIRESLIDAIAK
jgi:hypothetical protein